MKRTLAATVSVLALACVGPAWAGQSPVLDEYQPGFPTFDGGTSGGGGGHISAATHQQIASAVESGDTAQALEALAATSPAAGSADSDKGSQANKNDGSATNSPQSTSSPPRRAPTPSPAPAGGNAFGDAVDAVAASDGNYGVALLIGMALVAVAAGVVAATRRRDPPQHS